MPTKDQKEKWLIVDRSNESIEQANNKEEAIKTAEEMIDDGADIEDIKLYRILDVYKVRGAKISITPDDCWEW